MRKQNNDYGRTKYSYWTISTVRLMFPDYLSVLVTMVELNTLKTLFFLYFINEWNKLDPNIVATVVKIYFTIYC